MKQLIIKKNQNMLIPFELLKSSEKIEVVLAGENAQVEIAGLVVGKGNENKEIETNIVHAAPNTKSIVNVRAVLRDRSLFSFQGNVKIEKGAKGADAYLRSDVLLFDDAKMGDDTPALEILEKDVKAGHAATVGKVDSEMMFYLMSRGMSKIMAEKMLIEGFIQPILVKLEPHFTPILRSKTTTEGIEVTRGKEVKHIG